MLSPHCNLRLNSDREKEEPLSPWIADSNISQGICINSENESRVRSTNVQSLVARPATELSCAWVVDSAALYPVLPMLSIYPLSCQSRNRSSNQSVNNSQKTRAEGLLLAHNTNHEEEKKCRY